MCACLTSRDVWHLVLLYICTCVTLHAYNSGLCAEWSMCVSKTETCTPHPQVPSPTNSQHCSRKIKRKRHGLGKTYLFVLRRRTLSLLLSGECQLNSAIYISIAFWEKIKYQIQIQILYSTCLKRGKCLEKLLIVAITKRQVTVKSSKPPDLTRVVLSFQSLTHTSKDVNRP